MDVFFYEAFAEEATYLQQYLPPGIAAGFTRKTIQEYDAAEPPAQLISIRTQSVIPASWATKLAGILSRSTGYDHLEKYEGKAIIICPAATCRHTAAERLPNRPCCCGRHS